MTPITSLFLCAWMVMSVHQAISQEISSGLQQQYELVAGTGSADPDDDALQQLLEQSVTHKINVNSEAVGQLVRLGIVTDIQLNNLVRYRRLFGDLISIYELQAVPAWDPVMLRKLQQYVTVDAGASGRRLLQRFRNGEHMLVLRYSQNLETGREYMADANGMRKYMGSASKIFFRYRYLYKDKLQFGLTGDKDAGETFLRGANTAGFDFYSFHLFARQLGKVDCLAIGDYTVNMGQGLIHWQSMAFKKSADAMLVKRQSPVLRPYNSAGEYNFLRGIGISIAARRWQYTCFVSMRKISTNHDADQDGPFFSSILRSGYNRTASEIADRNNTLQRTMGAVASYRQGPFRISLNTIHTVYSLPLKKRPDPYNLFAMRGDTWFNSSLDYMYTWKNIHAFGEVALDARGMPAVITGIIASLHKVADLTLLYRNLHAGYQSVWGNAFTVNTSPGNERGCYAGITFRPASGWKIDLYSDLYRFPWLKYRVSALSYGRDWMVQVAYVPDKQVELTVRVRRNMEAVNTTSDSQLESPVYTPVLNWRSQLNVQVSKSISIRSRAEFISVGHEAAHGFLASADFICKPMQKPYSFSVRFQMHETDNYASRIYAYENDVQYAQSVPAFAGAGLRYYVLMRWDPFPSTACWIRFSTTHVSRTVTVDEPDDNDPMIQNPELKVQLRFSF